MNVLFLTMSPKLFDIEVGSIYTDLMRKFRDEGHAVYIVAPFERRTGKNTTLSHENGIHTLGVKTLNVTESGLIEKGIGQILLEYQYKAAIKNHLGNVDFDFDLVLYSTPPITFSKVIKYLKKSNTSSKTYLLLKDIFPQNAVDLGMMSKSGVKGLLYRSFRTMEKSLYALSDYIGCMSPANVAYLLKHNSEIASNKVEVAPNSYEAPREDVGEKLTESEKSEIRKKYNLPTDKPIFIYGGNLGKPQGIPFLIKCLEANKNRTDCHFVVIGKGTEYGRLEAWHKASKPSSVSIFNFIPKEDYDRLAEACDAGLIFLDYRFTIPNYPSRLLPYLMSKKPVIACTDPNCDTGAIAEENGYGLWCPSNDMDAFTKAVDKMLASDINAMGERGYQFFLNNYTVSHTYHAIMKHFDVR